MGIILFFRDRKIKRKMKLLLEHNPSSLSEFIAEECYEDIEEALRYMKSVMGKVNELETNKLLAGFEGKNLQKVVEFLIDHNYEFNVAQVIAQNNDLLLSYKIAFYCLKNKMITDYDFLKKHPRASIDLEAAISQDIRCIEFEQNGNPKLYVKVLQEIQQQLRQDFNVVKNIINGTSNLPKEEQEKIRQARQEDQCNFIEEETEKKRYDYIMNLLQEAIKTIKGEKPIKENKYHIPIIELYNIIKRLVRDYMTEYGKYRVNTDNIIEPIKSYIAKDGFFNKQFGEQFAKMYYNPATVIGIHNVAKRKGILESYFQKGLINVTTKTTVTHNVVLQESMFGSKAFSGFSMPELLNWNFRGGYSIIFEFPKKLAIEDGMSVYKGSPLIENNGIAPKYIVGAFDPLDPDTTLTLNPYYMEKTKGKEELQQEEK
ncbi:MAG: hypothetical protein HFJ28_04550 [Clostridia bacterium]|nr:hypothetical protein [Clostridia bacterium]